MIGAVVCCAAAVARRQPAGSEVRLHRRRDAVAAAGDAGDRRDLLRAGHGAGAEPAGEAYGIGVPTPEHPNPLLAPQATLMASVSHGDVRRRAAVDHGVDRRRDRRCDHRDRRLAEEARLELPRAGAGRCGRHLPAARTDGADLPRRPARVLRRAQRPASRRIPPITSACTRTACCSRPA